MSQPWLQQPERGNVFLMKLMIWIALRLGRRTARLLLHPICLYFLLSSGKARRASRKFLQLALGYKVGLKEVFLHYHCFAATMLDRVFFLDDQFDIFDMEINGDEVILERVKKKQGCILLGSHLGSFEAIRSQGVSLAKLPIKILMYQDNAENISKITKQMYPALADTIIPIGPPESMLRVKDCLDQGELVGILGDRVVGNDKTVQCQFLGHLATFPAGPMLLAAALKVPVILFFGLYLGDNRYKIHIELLADRIELSQSRRNEDLQYWTQRYVDRLGYYSRRAPYNWFNFYDCWSVTEK